jgi:hypothetical protein
MRVRDTDSPAEPLDPVVGDLGLGSSAPGHLRA